MEKVVLITGNFVIAKERNTESEDWEDPLQKPKYDQKPQAVFGALGRLW